jgi:hypothetical protein
MCAFLSVYPTTKPVKAIGFGVPLTDENSLATDPAVYTAHDAAMLEPGRQSES